MDVVFVGWSETQQSTIYSATDTLPTLVTSITVSGNATVYAVWGYDSNGNGIPDVMETKYTVDYDTNGGNANGPAQDTNVLDGTHTLSSVVPTYNYGSGTAVLFVGWSTTQDSTIYGTTGTLPALVTSITINGSSATVYAVWGYDTNNNGIPDITEPKYTVDYSTNGGSAGPAQDTDVLDGSHTLSSTVPTHSDIGNLRVLFIGWSETLDTTIYSAGDTVTTTLVTSITISGSNATVYAVWGYDTNGNGIPDVNEPQYTVDYDTNGGNNDGPAQDANVIDGTHTLNSTTIPTHAQDNGVDVVFLGWTTVADSYIYSANETAPATVTSVTINGGNTTVYAVWGYDVNGDGIPDVLEYSLTMQAGTGGSVDSTVDGLYLQGAVITITATKNSNYTFSCWTSSNGGTFADATAATTTFTMPAGDVTITASFTSNGSSGGGGSSSTTYTVSYSANGGTGGIKDSSLKKSSTYTVRTDSSAEVANDGYTFIGWNTQADGSGTSYLADETFAISGNVTLYAQWEVDTTIADVDTPTTEWGESLLNTEEHIAYLTGYADGTVRPDNAITRAEAATVFYKLLVTQGTASGGQFSDVSSGAWYAQAVNYLASIGILEGYSDGTFRPTATITRAEFATMAARFDDLSDATGNVFSDVSGSHWAVSYINSAYTKGWISGYADGTFRPENGITRAEVVSIVNAMLHRTADQDTLGSAENPYSDISSGHWAYADVMEASVEHTYTRDESGNEIWEF